MRLYSSKQGNADGMRTIAIVILVSLLVGFVIYIFMTAVKELG